MTGLKPNVIAMMEYMIAGGTALSIHMVDGDFCVVATLDSGLVAVGTGEWLADAVVATHKEYKKLEER